MTEGCKRCQRATKAIRYGNNYGVSNAVRREYGWNNDEANSITPTLIQGPDLSWNVLVCWYFRVDCMNSLFLHRKVNRKIYFFFILYLFF